MAITRVTGQVAKNNTGGATAASLTVTLPSAPTAGNIVVMAVSSGSGITLAPGGIE